MPDDADTPRPLHPAYRIIRDVEAAWSKDPQQAWQRATMVVRTLVDAGLLSGGELINGLYRDKQKPAAPAGE